MADLKCEVLLPIEKTDLNVGDRFALSCTGPEAIGMKLDKAELRLEEKDKHALKIMKIEKSDGGFRAQVVSYKVGDNDLKALQLVDDEQSLVLGDLKFTVKSVLDPKIEKPEPYGAFGGFRFIPYLFIFIVVSAVVLAIIPLVVAAFQALRRRRLMRSLDQVSYQLPPFQELHRFLRTQQRKYIFLSDAKAKSSSEELLSALLEMKTQYRIYLARQFRLPAHQWETRLAAKALRREQKQLPENVLSKITQALEELDRAEVGAKSLSGQDLFQIFGQLKNTSLEIERVRASGAARARAPGGVK